jgi:hypothetical protein
MTQSRAGAGPEQPANNHPITVFIAEVRCHPQDDLINPHYADCSHTFNDALMSLRTCDPEEVIIERMAELRTVMRMSAHYRHMRLDQREDMEEFIEQATDALRAITHLITLRPQALPA